MRSLFTASLVLACGGIAMHANADNLTDIYQAAVQNDPVMQAAEAQYRAEKESKNIARSALLPQLSLDAGIGYQKSETTLKKLDTDTPITGVDPKDLINQTSQGSTAQVALTLNWQLLNMNSWYTFKGGQELTEQAKIRFLDNQQALIQRVISAYLAVLQAQSNLSSSTAEEKAVKQQLDQMKQRYDVGLVAITDVNEAQAAYDLARVGLIANQGRLKIAYQALTVLTGGKAPESLDLLAKDFPVTSPEPADMEEWVKMAMQNNPSLKLAQSTTEAAQYQAKAAKAKHYPVLALQAQAKLNRNASEDGTMYSTDYNTLETQTDTYSVGLGLSVPLYSGGATSANRRKAYAQYDMARDNEIGTERQIQQQTRSQFIAALTAMQTVAARKQAIVSTTSALDATQAGYNVGTRNIVDVLDAQRNLFSAQRDYQNARYDYVNSIIELKYLAGTLTPEDVNSLNQWLVNK